MELVIAYNLKLEQILISGMQLFEWVSLIFPVYRKTAHLLLVVALYNLDNGLLIPSERGGGGL
jgi:hypothetical protein